MNPKPLLVLGRLPTEPVEGSAQRTVYVDTLFSKQPRLYVDWTRSGGSSFKDLRTASRSLKTGASQNSRTHQQVTLATLNPLHWFWFFWMFSQAKACYVHSLYGANSRIAKLALFLNRSTKLVWDVHGIIPEELSLLSNEALRPRFDRLEHEIARRADRIIAVSTPMIEHFTRKYPKLSPQLFYTMPVIGHFAGHIGSHTDALAEAKTQSGKTTVVYSGGAQTWQNPALVLDFFARQTVRFKFELFTESTAWFNAEIKRRGLSEVVQARTLPQRELQAAYHHADFGLILRDDHIVNRVACPTKVAEYLHFEMIPIVLSPLIGDYATLGYQFLTLIEIENSPLPTDAALTSMRIHNRQVLTELRKMQKQGAAQLLSFLDS